MEAGAHNSSKKPVKRTTYFRTINLTQTQPLLRLKELCNQGKYKFDFKWDKFANGYMITCELYFIQILNSRYILKKEVQWVETKDLDKAKNIICAILLEGLGMGVEDEESESEEGEMSEKIVDLGMKAMSGILEHFSAPGTTSTKPFENLETSEESEEINESEEKNPEVEENSEEVEENSEKIVEEVEEEIED